MNAAAQVVMRRCGDVAWLTINRADKANALTAEMMAEITEQVGHAAQDSAIKALVITGAGNRAFSGGVDLRSATELSPDENRRPRSQRFFELLITLEQFVLAFAAETSPMRSPT